MQGRLRSMTGIYLSDGDRLLLLHRRGSRVVDGLWVASAGGHFEPCEVSDAQACVLREMREELGLAPEDVRGLRLRYIGLRLVDGEIRQNYYFFAELPGGQAMPLHSDEGELRWCAHDELARLDMPYTARGVLDHYLAVGMHDDLLRVGVADGSRLVFTELAQG